MSVVRCRAAVSQPWASQTVNWADPISRGLVGLIHGAVGRAPCDLVTNYTAPAFGGPIYVPSGASYGQTAPGTAGGVTFNRMDPLTANWRPVSSILTFMTYFHYHAASTSQAIAGVGMGTSTGFYVGTTAGTSPVVAVLNDGASRSIISAANTLTLDSPNLVTMVSPGIGKTMTVYVGVITRGSVALSTTSSSITYDPTYTRVSLGSFGNTDFTAAAATGHWMALWNRALTLQEIRRINQNPWLLFAGARALALKKKAAAPAGGRVKVYSEASWLRKPLKCYSGTAWPTKITKRFNGTSWS